jgi:hypothetical protein
MKSGLLIFFLLWSVLSFAQDDDFKFGQVTYNDLAMTSYDRDTSAVALVLKEKGHSYIDNSGEITLIFKYHAVIKILKTQGLEKANITLPVYRNNGKAEVLRNIKASSFTIQNGSMIETPVSTRNIFTENYKYGDLKKFTIPNVAVGSVIEYEYELQTPFFTMNFKPWEFQTDIPKLSSEYWATIPANYRYNISLRGFLKLTKQEDELIRSCFSVGSGVSECVRYKWGIDHVPAFIEEDYMTSKKNFLSAIRFELRQIDYFDGRKDKVTKEWKDADQELRSHERFGVQLKKGKDVTAPELALIIAPEKDPLKRAEHIFAFMRNWYRWDGSETFLSEAGIKKAFEKRIGNSADINLSLVAALRNAGLEADPMILSTRDNGLPTDLFPVLTEFNYVVAKVDIADKSYLLDATDDFLPFGTLPERCLNGRGRVFSKSGSYWFDIKPNDKARQVVVVNLKVNDDGGVSGEVQTTYLGYKAAEKRSRVLGFSNLDEYKKDRKNKWRYGVVDDVAISNLDDFAKPLVEKLSIQLDPLTMPKGGAFLFNPFLFDKVVKNPFKSHERLYPVDFGVPIEETIIVNLELPEGVELDEFPERVGVALPNNGGRYIFQVQQNGKVLSVNSMLAISKTVFSSDEYHYLKELFNKMIGINQMDLVLKRI